MTLPFNEDTEPAARVAIGIDTVRVTFACKVFPKEITSRRDGKLRLPKKVRFGRDVWNDQGWLEFSAARQEHGDNLTPLSSAALLEPMIEGLFAQAREAGMLILDAAGDARLTRIDIAHDFKEAWWSSTILLGLFATRMAPEAASHIWSRPITGEPSNLVIGNKSWEMRVYRQDFKEYEDGEEAEPGSLRCELEIDRGGLRNEWVKALPLKHVRDVTDAKVEFCARYMFDECKLGKPFRPEHEVVYAIEQNEEFKTPGRRVRAYAGASVSGSNAGTAWMGYGKRTLDEVEADVWKTGVIVEGLPHSIRLDFDSHQIVGYTPIGTSSPPVSRSDQAQDDPTVSPVPSYSDRRKGERRTGVSSPTAASYAEPVHSGASDTRSDVSQTEHGAQKAGVLV